MRTGKSMKTPKILMYIFWGAVALAWVWAIYEIAKGS